ncbi:hypothetical protein Syun_012087 [Stephania yunnanensis]|uniref:Uncharacterized protein n=1 Tax=Stephania yunnanensis TaxID=152371 RepID=A0AAP0PG37_9MAGN
MNENEKILKELNKWKEYVKNHHQGIYEELENNTSGGFYTKRWPSIVFKHQLEEERIKALRSFQLVNVKVRVTRLNICVIAKCDMRQALETRLVAAEQIRKVVEQEKLDKEESARRYFAKQQDLMEKVVQESKQLH